MLWWSVHPSISLFRWIHLTSVRGRWRVVHLLLLLLRVRVRVLMLHLLWMVWRRRRIGLPLSRTLTGRHT